MLGHLAARGVAPVHGVDLSPKMIRQARGAHPGTSFAVADLRALPFEQSTFRGALAWYSIIHLPPNECAAAVREFGRVLIPGGLVLLAYQSGTGERLIDGAYGHDVAVHAYLHDTKHLTNLLTTEGFTTVAVADRQPRSHERSPQGFIVASRN